MVWARRTADAGLAWLSSYSNVTESKESAFSLRSIGLGFLLDGRPSRKDRKINQQLEAEEEAAVAEEQGAITKRSWWGFKKRKVVKHGTSTASRAANPVQATTDEAGKLQPPADPVQEKPQSGPDRAHTEYDEAPHTGHDGFVYGSKGSPGWKSRAWEDLKVGDFVKLTNNEAVPAGEVLSRVR